MTQEITIGVIGLGGICRQRHLPGFQKIPGVRLVAVANRSRASAERAAHDYDIPVICETWRDIIARDDINTVLIGTWPYLHCDASIAALQAGKHVFCQARMARNQDEAERMYQAARASGNVAALCPVPIGMSFDRAVARILREKEIGAVRYVSVRSFSDTWADPAAPITWRKDSRFSGLNMHTFGMYIEVIHRWFGNTRRVSGETFLYTASRPDDKGALVPVEIPDQITANTTLANDLPAQYAISTISGVASDVIDIYGTAGALHYNVNDDILAIKRDGTSSLVTVRPEEAYDVDNWRVEQDFVNAIRDGIPYHPDFADGLRYMRVLQATYDSATSGTRIDVPQDM